MLFALLPGAGCEPWIWHRVVPELRQRGHEAVAVRLPYDDQRAGLSEYPLVCTRLPVRLLVLVNAMIPLPGETAGAWWELVDHASALAAVVAEHDPLESWDQAAQVWSEIFVAGWSCTHARHRRSVGTDDGRQRLKPGGRLIAHTVQPARAGAPAGGA